VPKTNFSRLSVESISFRISSIQAKMEENWIYLRKLSRNYVALFR